MSTERRWVDAVNTNPQKAGAVYCPNSHPRRDLGVPLEEYVPGDVLRVYLGTFMMNPGSRLPMVTIANCSPTARKKTKELFGRAVFVGPRAEAFELFYAHCHMLFGAA